METAPLQKSESKNKQPTALIVGGAGFIGSHLCETLVSQNFQVICVDNLSTGKRENLKDILTATNFTFIEADINDPNFRLGEGVKIDYCFHLASIEEYKSDKNLSLDTLLVNSLGTRQLLEISKANQAKFILFSSADLYSGAISSSSLRYYFGKNPEGEGILSVHEAKRFAEALTFEYFKKFNLETTVIRLKDAYGPRMNLDRGDEIASLIKAAITQDNLVVYGDGLKTLNPTFVSDIVFATVKAVLGNFSGEIFILVNGEKVTVESFAQTVKLVSGPLEIEHKKALDAFELPSYHLDLENTKEKLSWNPKVSLAEGLANVVQQQRIKDEKTIRQKEDKLDEVKIASLTREDREVTKIIEKEKPKTKKAIWLRLSIFIFSALLLVFTIFYPIGSVVFNSYSATGDLQEAVADLSSDRVNLAIKNSMQAQNSFGAAEQSLQNVNWLLKIVGLNGYSANLDRFYSAAANLSEAVRNTAVANQTLVDTAAKSDITPEEAKKKLEEALINLYKSQEEIEQSQLVQQAVNWDKLPNAILPEKTFFAETTASLSREIEQLISSIESSLNPEPTE